MGRTVIFAGIGRLVTLKGAADKKGRRVVASDLSIVSDGVIVGRNGSIAWTGAKKDLPREFKKSAHTKVDFGGASVVPAFIECHTHLVFAGNRADEFERRLGGESYQSIARSGGGILSTVGKTRAASESGLVATGQKRVDRFLAQGVGTIEIKSGYGLSLEHETKMLKSAGKLKKARIVRTFLGPHAQSPDFKTPEEYIEYLVSVALPKIAKAKLADRADIFVEAGYFSPAQAERYLKRAQELGLAIAVHADQLTLSGGSDVAVKLGAQSAEHLIKIGSREIEKLAKSDLSCVLLPSSDLYMQCDYPPARKLIDAGARVALATDFNPGSSPSQDIALVGLLARLEMKMSLPEVISAYTVAAAHALGRSSEIGSIETGKSCDFAVLTGEVEELFYEVGHMPIGKLFISGKQVRI
ncbi:MAG: imidazolonepropionase [Bdellovibrionota bacterium]